MYWIGLLWDFKKMNLTEKIFISELAKYNRHLLGRTWNALLVWGSTTSLRHEYHKGSIYIFPLPFLHCTNPFSLEILCPGSNYCTVDSKIGVINFVCTLIHVHFRFYFRRISSFNLWNVFQFPHLGLQNYCVFQ